MPRRPASYTEADIDRALRCAKKHGCPSVTLETERGAKVTIHLKDVDNPEKEIEPAGGVTL